MNTTTRKASKSAAIIAAAAAAGVEVEVVEDVEDTPHPDFSRRLLARQVAWCKANGIATKKSMTRTAGFFFVKGDRRILPVTTTAAGVRLVEDVRNEKGVVLETRVVATFDRLRDALAELVK